MELVISYGTGRQVGKVICGTGSSPQFVHLHVVRGRHCTNHFVLHGYNACTYMHM